MSNFTFDEINLMCIYNTGTRAGLMQALTDMRGQLEPDEAELRELTDSALRKLGRITDEQFEAIKNHCINPVDSRETGTTTLPFPGRVGVVFVSGNPVFSPSEYF